MPEIIENSNIVEPVANVEPQNNDVVNNEPIQTNIAEPVEPQQGNEPQQKTVQSPEENAKFAEVRRKAAEEAKIKARDEVIAEMYGESHGIHTYAEYREAIAKQEQEQRLTEIREQGIEPDLIRQYAEDLPEVKEAKQMKRDRESMAALFEIAPEITDAKQIPSEVITAYLQGKDLASEYAVWKLKNDLKEKAIAKANAENAKSSTGSVSTNGAANDGYFTKDQVSKMTPKEVASNYEKICESTKKW